MANEYMRKCSTSLPTREMQIRCTMRYYLISAIMAEIQKTVTSAGEGVEEVKHLYSDLNQCGHSGKQSEDFLK